MSKLISRNNNNTTKGKGVSFSENNNDWHHNILTKKNYDLAVEELNNAKR